VEKRSEGGVKGRLDSSNDVIPGDCHHSASGALNRFTDREQQMKTLM